LTGVIVAASQNATGNSEQQGDWDLEFATATVRHDLPIRQKELQAFPDLLYIDHAVAPVFSVAPGADCYINGAAGLPGGKTALLKQCYDGSLNPLQSSILVVSSTGQILTTKDITATMGSRATNHLQANIHALSNGNIFVTWEGTVDGCDNNTSSPYQFAILNSSGTIIRSATDISEATASHNCYGGASELSNGNIAFFYQRTGSEYRLRIFDAYGSAVTGSIVVPKLAGCTSTYSHAIAANNAGTLMLVGNCYNNSSYFGISFTNDGTQTAGPYSIFNFGTLASPQSTVAALSDNNYAVLYKTGSPGANRTAEIRILQSDGTASAVINDPSPVRQVSSWGRETITGLEDGGFVVGYGHWYNPWTPSNYAELFQNNGALVETDRQLDTDANLDWSHGLIKPGKEKGFFYINEATWQEHLYQYTSMPTSNPTVTTDAATDIEPYTATLKGTVNVHDGSSTITFEYGLNTAYGRTLAADQSPVAGSIDTAVIKTITGLTPNTTYHYRVICINAFSTTYGEDMSFTTEAIPPTVTTSAASGIGAGGATLNGSVNANYADTAVSFDYSQSLSYGTSVAAGSVSGSSPNNVSATVSGLKPNTAYYFRAAGSNLGGQTNGADLSFTTDAIPPTVTVSAAGAIGTHGATLQGTVNANNAGTAVSFQYGLTTAYGTTVIATPGSVIGDTATAVSAAIIGLDPNIAYHYLVVGQNIAGTTNSGDLTFTTLAAPPLVTTSAANGIGADTAQLNGTVDANNSETDVSFEYGLTTDYGTTATAMPNSVTGHSSTAVSASISGLRPNTTYHFRAVGSNTAGTTYGQDITLTTTAIAPTVTTSAAGGVSSGTATVNGTVNANYAVTTVTFEYGLTTDYGASVNAAPNPVNGGSETAVTGTITGLAPNTTYYYRVVGFNTAGSTNGSDMTFTTAAIPPTVTTTAAGDVGTSSATMNGTVKANNAEATATFDYGLTTAYGTTVTAAPSPVGGDMATAVAAAITGLNPNTTYHYQAVGTNIAGSANGSDLTFTTMAIAPSVTTTTVVGVTSAGVTLSGLVNPYYAATTVTFEYGPTTTYGASVSAAQSPVSGGGETAVTGVLTGLAPITTYHYRVIGVNAGGTTYGNDLSFTTAAAPPAVETMTASDVDTDRARLNGLINANNTSTSVSFDYGPTTEYGTTVAVGSVDGSLATGVTADITGLGPNSTYHYRVVGANTAGTTEGNDMTFTTVSSPPAVTTEGVTEEGRTGVRLSGTVNPYNARTTVSFEYGLTAGYGATIDADQSPVEGDAVTGVSTTVTGLAPNNTYHYRAVGTNIAGTTYGSDISFTIVTLWTLNMTKEGHGDGIVTSIPAGIHCGSECSKEYSHNTTVTLSAIPKAQSRFLGWSGDPDCEDGVVTMTGDVSCTANFYRFPWWLFYEAITKDK
jgi:phosphodiesterase/alkaline phosphatase D-like protein